MIREDASNTTGEFIPAQNQKRLMVFVGQEDHDGKVTYQPASLRYNHMARPHDSTHRTSHMTKDYSLQSFFKWVGLSIPLITAVVIATCWVNSTIDSKTHQNYIEMKGDLAATKQDLMTQEIRTQDAVQRLSDRTDERFDKVNDNLNDIKTILIPQQSKNR